MLIVLPLAAAALTQAAMRQTPSVRAVAAVEASMVPLMMVVLFLVVASQARLVVDRIGAVAAVVPLYAGFLVVMAGVGVVAARVARLDVAGARALTFSGATRKLAGRAAARPRPAASLALAPAVVVTQTLVELVGMIVYVRLVPRLLPAR